MVESCMDAALYALLVVWSTMEKNVKMGTKQNTSFCYFIAENEHVSFCLFLCILQLFS